MQNHRNKRYPQGTKLKRVTEDKEKYLWYTQLAKVFRYLKSKISKNPHKPVEKFEKTYEKRTY